MRLLTRILFLLFIPVFSASGQTANFTADFVEGCAPLVVHFTNTSVGATHYDWDLGNGVTTPLTDPSTSYITAGTYTVTLIAYNGTISSDTQHMIIQIYAEPTIKFGADDTAVCPGTVVTFTDSTVSNVPGPMNYVWNFGDGFSSTNANPAHTFNAPGYRNITVAVTNNKGCNAILTYPSYIHVYTPPVANFNVNSRHFCSLPSAAVFTNSTTGTALAYSWSFGDGGVSTVVSPAHDYTVSGVYSVTLTVNDGFGCGDTLSRPSYIFAASLKASYARPDTACLDAPVTFTNTSSPHLSTTWIFGDGETSTNDPTVAHTYSATGTYTASIVEYDGFCRDTSTSDLAIITGPAASFTMSPLHPCPAPSVVTYTATAPGATSVTWQFDDGSSGAGNPVPHNYLTTGYHPITMNAKNVWGCITSVTDSFLQYGMFLKITPERPSGCIPLNIPFSVDAYTMEPDSPKYPYPPHPYPFALNSYSWDFGDGSPSSSAATPSHTYTDTGTYFAKVTTTTANGCIITDSMKVAAGIPPTVEFTVISPTHVCAKTTIFFLVNVNDYANAFAWDYGDGGTDTVYTLINSHKFSLPGDFTPTLIGVYNGCPGAPYTTTTHLLIDSPSAEFSVGYQCSEPVTTVSFTNNAIGASSVTWLFGDGDSSSLLNPVHNYPSIGSYDARFATYNAASGCRDTVDKTINILNPSSDLYANDTTICRDGFVNLAASITGGAVHLYKWFVNDTLKSSSGIASTFTYTFHNTGLYTIKLMTSDDHGCWDTVTKTNYITVAKPVASFLAPSPTGCLPLTVNFADTSTDVPGVTFTNFLWSFGDGATNSIATPSVSHIYTAAGTYDVQEIVTDSIGCMDTVTRTALVVTSNTDASFSVTPSPTCAGRTINFTRLYAGTTGSQWFFGDGDTSSAPSPVHVYSATGTYTVMHVVTDPSGCIDTAVKSILVTRPHASFTMSDTIAVCPPLFVNFSNGSSDAASYYWSFGDGNSSIATAPNNVYTTPGYFTAELVAIDTNGCTDTAISHVRLYGYIGVFTTAPSVSGCAPLTVNFNATLTNVANIVWDFADGITSPPSLSTTATHTYTLPGAYLPKLVLTDSNGCTTASPGADTIKVNGVIPGFIINPPNLCLGNTFTCTDTSGSFWSSVTPRLWIFNGDSSLLPSPTFTADTAGTFAVTLYVSNDSGCSGTATNYISVSKPVTSFTASSPGGCIPYTITFTDHSTDIPGISLTNYAWSFGDGAGISGTAMAVTHTYTASGIYDVQEIVTDSLGCMDTLLSTAFVNVSNTDASFTSSILHTCIGSTVSFTRLYPGTTGSKWFFGDGVTSTVPSPTHVYTATGTFTVMHIVTDPSGCIDTTRYINYITVTKPHAAFTMSDTVICAPLLVTFNNGSSNAVNYNWNFGDGQTSIATTPTNVYSLWGYLPVTLVASDIYGCMDTATRHIRVHGATGNFTTTPANGCAPLLVNFNSTVNHAASIVWNFADGTTSTTSLTTTAVTHIYSLTGTYLPKIVVNDSFGCHTTVFGPDTIKSDKITPGFIATPTTLCRGAVFTCTDTSGTSLTPITSRLWTFRSYSSSSATASFVADTVGSYAVTLQVSNNTGCTGSAIKYISASGPTTAFTAPSTSGCTPITVNFTDHSTDVSGITFTGYEWSFGDGSGTAGTASSAAHTYTTPGVYDVREIVTNSNGCKDTLIRSTFINTSNADASFTASTTHGCIGVDISFTRLYPGTTGSQWFFGDGAVSSVPSPAHAYSATGTYTVMHTVTDPSGCVDTARYINYITVTKPNAAFGMSSTNVCPPALVTFINGSSGAASYNWDFGDGNTSTATTPGNTYTSPGYLPITLTAADTNGCTDTAIRYIQVRGATGSFSVTPTHGCAPLAAHFVITAMSPADSMVWVFGDGNTMYIPFGGSTGYNLYSLPGTYLPKLIFRDASGCVTTFTADTIKVDKINAGFTTPEHLCKGASFHCVDTTVSYFSSVTTRNWSFMTDTSTAAGPTFIASTLGSFPISLYVTNGSGCRDTETKIIYVYPPPDTGIITGPSVLCQGASIILSDTVYGGTWVLSSTAIATFIPVDAGVISLTGLSAGTDVILYIVTNGFCSDTTSKAITVYGLPPMDSITGQPKTCIGAQFTLADSANGGLWSSDNTTIAIIDSITGIVHSLSAGTATISYTVGPDSNNCFNTAAYTLSVTAQATFSTDSSVSQVTCYGNDDGIITVSLSEEEAPILYVWSNGGTDSAISALAPGVYTLSITEVPTQCTVTDSFYISQPDSITVTPSVTNDPCHQNMGSIHIDASGGTQPLSYLWSNNQSAGTGLTGLNAGIYTVTVTDGNNCIKMYPVTVNDDTCFSIIVPDAITPNGDGINDTWVIEALSLYPDNYVGIFDKWGDAVYEKKNYQNDWHGTGKNGLLPDGTYFYVIKLNAQNLKGGSNMFTGAILIKR